MKTILIILFLIISTACFSQTAQDSTRYRQYSQLVNYFTDLAKRADLSADSFYYKGRADSYEDSMQAEAQALAEIYRKEHETK